MATERAAAHYADRAGMARAIVSLGGIAGGDGDIPRVAMYNAGVVFAQIRAREYPRETGRDNICRDLHACPAGRPLFSYRNAAARDEAAYP